MHKNSPSPVPGPGRQLHKKLFPATQSVLFQSCHFLLLLFQDAPYFSQFPDPKLEQCFQELLQTLFRLISIEPEPAYPRVCCCWPTWAAVHRLLSVSWELPLLGQLGILLSGAANIENAICSEDSEPLQSGNIEIGAWLEVPAPVIGCSLCQLRISQGAQASLGPHERLMILFFI